LLWCGRELFFISCFFSKNGKIPGPSALDPTDFSFACPKEKSAKENDTPGGLRAPFLGGLRNSPPLNFPRGGSDSPRPRFPKNGVLRTPQGAPKQNHSLSVTTANIKNWLNNKWLWLGTALVLAAALRFYRLGDLRAYDVDEAHMVLLAQGSPLEVIQRLHTDAYPPLYFLLMNVWTRLWGVTEAATRSFSALAGVGAVGLAFIVGRRFLPVGAAGAGALVLAAAPLHVFFSREARMYALIVFWSLVLLYFFWRALEEGRRSLWVGTGAALLLLSYTHSIGVFFFPACLAAAILMRRWGRLPALAATLGVASLLFLPWVPALLYQSGSGHDSWIGAYFRELPPWAAVLRSLEVLGAGGLYPVTNYALAYHHLRWLAIPLYVWILVGFARAPLRPGAKPLLLTMLLTPLLIVWVYSLSVKPIYLVGRYDVTVAAFYALILGLGVWNGPPAARGVLLAACLALSGYSLYPAVAHSPQLPAPERAAFIMARAQATDMVLVTDVISQPTRIEFLKKKFPIEVRNFPSEIDRHPGWADYSRMDATALEQEALGTALALTKRGRVTWFIAGGDNIASRLIFEALGRFMRLDAGMSSQGLSIYRFVPEGSPNAARERPRR